MFGMTKPQVTKQVAQMIMQNRLQMSLDPKNDLLVVNEAATDIRELQ